MQDVEVIEQASTALVALDPVRGRLLRELVTPGSAASLAARLGITRQKVNYYLQSLEQRGLVRVVEQRHWGGLTERIFVASAASYVVSSNALGELGADPARTADRLSAGYVVALGSRIVREVGALMRRARAADKRLATLSIDTQVRFRTPADRAAFTRELAQSITALVARYHDEKAADGRDYRLVLVAHPAAPQEEE